MELHVGTNKSFILFRSLEQTVDVPVPQMMVAHLVFGVSALSRK